MYFFRMSQGRGHRPICLGTSLAASTSAQACTESTFITQDYELVERPFYLHHSFIERLPCKPARPVFKSVHGLKPRDTANNLKCDKLLPSVYLRARALTCLYRSICHASSIGCSAQSSEARGLNFLCI